MDKLIVIDGNSLLFRAFYATSFAGPESIMRTSFNQPTNAIFAFGNMILKILAKLGKNDGIFVGFDCDSQTFRKEEFADYKANRKPCPEELKTQFPLSRDLLSSLSITHFELHGVEADDICGSVAKEASRKGIKVEIYTSDRDYLQLIDKNISINLPVKGLSELKNVNEDNIFSEFGFYPLQTITYKGLRGDSSDNLPGIAGIGDVTAKKLIQEYKDFDSIILAAKEGKIKGKMAQKIIDGEAIGRECLKLATIKLDIDLPFDLDSLLYKGYEYSKAKAFTSKYELKQLEAKLSTSDLKKEEKKVDVIVLSSLDSITFKDGFSFYFDIDDGPYYNLTPHGVALFMDDKSYYVPFSLILENPRFKEALENKDISKVTYDYKKAIVILNKFGIGLNGDIFDAMLSSYVLDSSICAVEESCFEYYGLSVDHDEISLLSSFNKNRCTSIARNSYLIKDKALSLLKDNNQLDLYNNIELPLARILAKMEIEGFPLSKDELSSLGKGFKDKLKEEEEILFKLAGHPFNPASPKQVSAILFDEMKLISPKGKGTSSDILNSLLDKSEFPKHLLEYRKYAKLLGTYVDGFIPHIQEDGKVHTIFNQALTTTGRLSSSNPNLQNISGKDEDGLKVKACFHYPSNMIMALDYSQVELRVLASLANSKDYKEIFSSSRDIHSETARKVFGLSKDEEVPHALRKKAKAVNFAIIYGTTPYGLSEQIGCSPAEASSLIKSFYTHYPEIRAYLSSIIENAEKSGYVETMFGRRRYLPDLTSPNFAKREAAKRAALNAPVQGSAADLIKIAMIKVDEFLTKNNYKSKMVLQIHDELDFLLDKDEESFLPNKIKEIMETCVNMDVKLEASCSFGSNFASTKD